MFGGPARRKLLELSRGFSFFRRFSSQLLACLSFTIERLGNRCRAARAAEKQDLNFELSSVIGDSQHVSDPHLSRCFDRLTTKHDPSQLAGASGQGARLKE